MKNDNLLKDLVGNNIGNLTKAGILAVGAVGTGVLAVGGIVAKKVSYNLIRDKDGFNKNGYDRQGYDHDGYDKNGFNRSGYDRQGYDRNGYDPLGYDRKGYDREGYDCSGYDHDGYDHDGYDKKGYDHQGYNIRGFNCVGKNRSGQKISDIEKAINKAKKHSKKGWTSLNRNFIDSSATECRKGLEMLLKQNIFHYLGESYYTKSSCENIKTSEQYDLFTSDEIDKLHQARKICNRAVHASEEEVTHNEAYFSLKTLDWLIGKTAAIIAE